MTLLRPCVTCGEPSEETRCTEHRLGNPPPFRRIPKSPRDYGYDAAWDRLSKRARRLQPFCLDCGATEDLQCDHTPEAWERKEQGLPIRLSDVAVRCGECNRKAGAARGRNVRQRGSQGTRGHEADHAVRAPKRSRQNLSHTPGGW